MSRSPLRRTRHGRWQVRLAPRERQLLRELPGQVQQLIRRNDPSVARLFPPAYGDDPEQEREYRRLVGDQLSEHHHQALAVLSQTADAADLDDDQLGAWLGALNDLRLVLGTRLELTEDMAPIMPGDVRAPAYAVYVFLSALQERIVTAMSASLPESPRAG